MKSEHLDLDRVRIKKENIMDKKKKKLTEEELNEVGTAQPVPATSQEVAAATPETAPAPTPAAEEPVDVVATPQVPADDSPAIDPLTPPAEGMVPTGWAYPEDLAAAVAMATGDVEAAGTAADATVTDEPLVSEESVEGAEPVSVAPQTTDDLTMEEKQLIINFRKKKLKESDDVMSEELPELSQDAMTDVDMLPSEQEEGVMLDDTIPVVDGAEDDPSVDIDAILASIDAVFGEDEECEECEEEGEEEGEEEEECEECEEESSVEEVSQTFDKLAYVLDRLNDVDADDVEDMAAEDPGITKSEVEKAFDFLSVLEDNIFNDEDTSDKEKEEAVEEEEECEECEEEDEAPSEEFTFSSAIKEAIKYPAGSAPKTSAIASSTDESVGDSAIKSEADSGIMDDHEENLVRSYEQKSRARREAFVNFRDSIIQKRKEGSRFNEALNSGTDTNTASAENSKAWSNNTFMAKYNESRKLNWKELFDKGLLG